MEILLKKKVQYTCSGTVNFYTCNSTSTTATFGVEFITPPTVTCIITVNQDSKFGSTSPSNIQTTYCTVNIYMPSPTAHERSATVQWTATGWIYE